MERVSLELRKKLDFKNSYAAKGSAQAGEMAQPLGTCTALKKASVPSTHVDCLLAALNPALENLPLSGLRGHLHLCSCNHRHTCTQITKK